MSTEKFSGKVAIVTGAGRGLGRAAAVGLAAAGAHIVATARTASEIEATARNATGPGTILSITADVTSEADCRRVVDRALNAFGGVHLLVNNAGLGMRTISPSFLTKPSRFWEADPEAWKALIDANVNGPFLMARATVPHMLAGGWGRIVNVSMNYSTMVRKGFSPYGPSKAALESETFIWAQELDGSGVTVNALLPGGATLTGMIPDGVPDDLKARLLDPAIMVPPLLWLASRASDGVTGKRLNASLWRQDLDEMEAAKLAVEDAGVWPRRNLNQQKN